MSITDELREYADTLSERARFGATIPSPLNPHSGAPIGPTKETEELYTIADRIDAEHEHELDHVRNQASEGLAKQWNYGYDVGFASADDWLEQHEGAMAEHGWIRLPKDADGKYIHIGDELEGYGYPKGGAYCKAIVNDVTILAGPIGSFYKSWLMWDATEVRHHHEPTVEDVLREFASAYDRIGGEDEEHQKYLDLIAEYAAKLQLKERK